MTGEMWLSLRLVFLTLTVAYLKVYFHETFDEGFEKQWVNSEDTSVTHGSFLRVQKKHCADGDFGIKSANDSSYYHMSAKLGETLDLTKKPLFFHYVAQYEQNIDCGGAYLKLFETLDQKKLAGTSPYSIMVGPDVCGYGTKVVHLILSHKGTNYPMKNTESFTSDTKPHLFQLHIDVDGHFYLKVDGDTKKEGALSDVFDYLPPKRIDDPNSKKPADWVDEEMMLDENDKKPQDWDEVKHIPDPKAEKPADWDDEKDGEWERDMVENPSYKGEWTQKKITNPAYKGTWTPAQIDNPEYKPDNTFGQFKLNYIGYDLWTVKSGTVFDEILVSDDAIEAGEHAKKVIESIVAQGKAIDEAEKASSPVEAGDDDVPPGTHEEEMEPEDDESDKKDESDRDDL